MRDSFKPRESLRIMKKTLLYDLRGYLTIEKHMPDGRLVTAPTKPNSLTPEGKQSLIVALTGETDWAPLPYELGSGAQMRVLSKTSTERVGWVNVGAAYPTYEADYRARLQWNIAPGVGTGDWDQILLRDGTAEVILTQFLDGYLDWGDKGADEAWTVKYDFIAK